MCPKTEFGIIQPSLRYKLSAYTLMGDGDRQSLFTLAQQQQKSEGYLLISKPSKYITETKVNSAFYSSWVGRSSTGLSGRL